MKERTYSQVTLPDELATALQENFDVQFDTVRSNDELQDLIQLKYRLDVNTAMSPQETHDMLETMIAFSGVASEQLDFFRQTNDALLSQQTAIAKAESSARWQRLLHPTKTVELIISTERGGKILEEKAKKCRESMGMSSKAKKQVAPLSLPNLSISAAKEKLKRVGGAYNRGLQQLYGNLWGNKYDIWLYHL